MKPKLFTSTLVFGAICITSAHGSEVAAVAEMARASGCYSCHATAEKIVGPAFQDISSKYAGDQDAAASLAQSIQNGTRGKWGRVPMPPHASLSADDSKKLATWVLSNKP